ncbi:MAG TPA: protein kinase, partial [Methylomirabilota bacterium]|nr:protein kinase [Methylomirabilota bacterium]
MGVVFLARQRSLNRVVALKLLTGGAYASEEMIKRFKSEAETAGGLHHPNIVPIYDIGEHEGEPYFSMAYINGRPLHALATEPWTDLKRAAVIIRKMAEAVHHAHQHGVIHRDIKPSNILIDREGEPHLMDFGIAKLLNLDSALTHTNLLLGTPSYVAPEIARGEMKHASVSVDVYGLGAVLYHLLTGAPPFAGGTSMQTLKAVIEHEPHRPSIFNAALDRDLETITLKCLAKAPAERYPSASNLAADLDRWLRGEPILARPITRAERVLKWVARHPVYSAMSAMLISSLIAGAVGITWQWQRADEQREIAEAQKTFAQVQKKIADDQRDFAKLQAYAADISLAQKLLADGSMPRAVELLARHIPAPDAPDLRGVEWQFLWGLIHAERYEAFDPPPGFQSLIQSADSVLFQNKDGSLALRDHQTLELIARLPSVGPLGAHVEYLHTKKWLLVTRAGEPLRLLNSRTGQQIWAREFPGEALRSKFSPNGQFVAVASGPSDDPNAMEVRLLDGASGEVHHVFPHHGCDQMAFSLDGSSFTITLDRGFRTYALPDCKPGAIMSPWSGAHVALVSATN